MRDDMPSPPELAALQSQGFDALVTGNVAHALAEGTWAERVRLARYEQFAGREVEANTRLCAILNDLSCPDWAHREARSQQWLGAAFEPEFLENEPSWANIDPSTDLDAGGIRERVAIAWGRFMIDGREPPGGWPRDYEPPAWTDQSRMIDEAHSALLRRLPRADLAEFLRLVDLIVWCTTLLLTINDSQRALELLRAGRKAQTRLRLRFLDHFLDYQESTALVGQLDIENAVPLLERALAGLSQAADPRWWMHAKAVQALISSVTHTPLPADMARLEHALISGSWRRGRRSLGQATLMLLSVALASRGDLEGAQRIALADGALGELTIPTTDRAFIAEIIFNSALFERDIDTCEEMIAYTDRLMSSPAVLTVRDRMATAIRAYRQGTPPSPIPEPDADPSFEALRTRWGILAQTVAFGSRGETWSALADFEAFAGRTAAAAMRQRAVRLLHDRVNVGATETLSPRQMEVVALAAAGRSNQEIADQLFLSLRTIEDYVGQAIRKLGLSQRIELATVELPLELRNHDLSSVIHRLPLRQGQVGALISAGASNSEIAEALDISRKTLDVHISTLKKRLGASTRTEIAAIFAS